MFLEHYQVFVTTVDLRVSCGRWFRWSLECAFPQVQHRETSIKCATSVSAVYEKLLIACCTSNLQEKVFCGSDTRVIPLKGNLESNASPANYAL